MVTLDNTHSMFRSKNVEYRFDVSVAEGEEEQVNGEGGGGPALPATMFEGGAEDE